MSRPRAVVLTSGGMDSAVTVAIAAQTHDVALLHATYGQRTAVRERRAFEAIADHYRVGDRLVLDLSHLSAIGGSALTDADAALETYDPATTGQGAIPRSYVPFRNANLLSAAVSWAEALGAEAVYIGAVEADSSGYPDCRATFLEAFEAAADLGTRPDTHIAIRAPLIELSKADIVRRGVELDAPLHLTWSCYQAEERACGVCESCGLRLKGFADAGHPDPIPYA